MALNFGQSTGLFGRSEFKYQIAGSAGGTAISSGDTSTYFYPMGEAFYAGGTDDTLMVFTKKTAIRNLFVYVNSNSLLGSLVIKVEKRGKDQSVVLPDNISVTYGISEYGMEKKRIIRTILR